MTEKEVTDLLLSFRIYSPNRILDVIHRLDPERGIVSGTRRELEVLNDTRKETLSPIFVIKKKNFRSFRQRS